MHSQAERGNDKGLSLKHCRAHPPRGHAVLDAPRPFFAVRPAERQKLNNPLFPQPLVQRVAAHAQLFGQQ